MDVKWLIADVFYIAFILIVFAMLPSSMVSGQPTTSLNDISDGLPSNYDDAQDRGTFSSMMSFFFITWNVDGIPTVIGSVIALLNWISVVVILLYVFELFWW